MDDDYCEKLSSYGTLQYESVQIATFGRKLDGAQDVLRGYLLSHVTIEDPDVLAASGDAAHPIITHTGNEQDEIAGMVFAISKAELQ